MALDSVLSKPYVNKCGVESLVSIGTGIPSNLFNPEMVTKKNVNLSEAQVSKTLVGDDWNGNKLYQLNTALYRIRVVYKVLAETIMDRVVQVLGIHNSCGQAITTRQELRQEMIHLSDTSNGNNWHLLMNCAFALNVFQRCNGNEYGKKVSAYVAKEFGYKLQECHNLHCFGQLARRIYDRVGHPFIEHLRKNGGIYWRLQQLNNKTSNVQELVTLKWTNHHPVYFYRRTGKKHVEESGKCLEINGRELILFSSHLYIDVFTYP